MNSLLLVYTLGFAQGEVYYEKFCITVVRLLLSDWFASLSTYNSEDCININSNFNKKVMLPSKKINVLCRVTEHPR